VAALLKEEEIYIAMKEWLKGMCWQIIGGEPPAGTNVIPRIEIKDPSYRGRGSKGSKKVDLVSFKGGYFLLTEIKNRFSPHDVKKLEEITQKEELRKAFLIALKEKRVFPRGALSDEHYINTTDYMIKSLAFSYPQIAPYDNFIFFLVSPSISIKFGPEVPTSVRNLFLRSTTHTQDARGK
jgi:hypothetical protein